MNDDEGRLWAKSWSTNDDPPRHVFLLGHLQDVYAAAGRVLSCTADNQLRAVGLEPEEWRDRLRRIVLLGAAIHDLGKANDHFDGMICRKRDVRTNPQGLRHEWVTILMLRHLRDWLLPAVNANSIDFAIVEWSVAGHHPAYHHPSPPKECPPGAGSEIRLLYGRKEFAQILRWLQQAFSLSHDIPAVQELRRNLTGPGHVFTDTMSWAKTAHRQWEEQIKRSPLARLVAVAKNCLIAADVAGSALPRCLPTDRDRWQHLDRAFGNVPDPDDLQFIVDWRLKREKLKGKTGQLMTFQLAVADSSSAVTFVKAGCGTGKTLAAYQWAARQHPRRRLYFCYPTTGTATEGFKDYLFPAELGSNANDPDADRLRRIEADLFHSRADVDFEIILTTGRDAHFDEADAVLRLESLEAWSTPVVACTVDTVLGLVQNNKRGLFAWPALAQAAFVFDEIHAYDDRLFGALLRFLRDLPGLPALLMTASLPQAREEALRNALAIRGVELKAICGPTDLEELPRYHKAAMTGKDPFPFVEQAWKEGGKVLWVCNTISRVMEAAERAQGLNPLIYHSRFKYEDRVERHKAVIEAFTPEKKGSTLAICSQVAEMSLDLKGCTLLVTDIAPVPALIQRLGRLNRQALAGDPTRPFIVVEPDNHLPYTPADVEAARSWLSKLPTGDISQRNLAECWEQSAENPPDLVPSAWLDGGPTTSVTELREASPGVTVIMEEDLPHLKKRPKDLARLTLPMPPPPRSLDWRSWPLHRGLPVAPMGTINYDKMRGAEWRK